MPQSPADQLRALAYKSLGVSNADDLRSKAYASLLGKSVQEHPSVKWEDIYSKLDPNMPAQQYDAIRQKYFIDQIAPTVKPGFSTESTFQEFMKRTERPSTLSSTEKALVQTGLFLTSVVGGALPGAMGDEKQKLQAIAEREGIDSPIVSTIGDMAGMALTAGPWLKGAGAVTSFLGAKFLQGVKGAEYITKASQGGLAFATYNALSAEEGDRVRAGVNGALIGSLAELGLARFFGHSEKAAEEGVKATTTATVDPGTALIGPLNRDFTVDVATPLRGRPVRQPVALLEQMPFRAESNRLLTEGNSQFTSANPLAAPANNRMIRNAAGELVNDVSELDTSRVIGNTGWTNTFTYRDPATGKMTTGFMGGELSSALQQSAVTAAKRAGFQISAPTMNPKMNNIIAVLGNGTLRTIGAGNEEQFISEMDTYLRTGGSIDKFLFGPKRKVQMNRIMALLGERAEEDSLGTFIRVEKGQWGPVVDTLTKNGEIVAATPNPDVLEVKPNRGRRIKKTIDASKAIPRTDFPDDTSRVLYRIGEIRNAIRASGEGLSAPVPREIHSELHHLAGELGQQFNMERSQVGQLGLRYFEKNALSKDAIESATPFIERYQGRGNFPAGERPPAGWKGDRLRGFKSATENDIGEVGPTENEDLRFWNMDGRLRVRPTGVIKFVPKEALEEAGASAMSLQHPTTGEIMDILPEGEPVNARNLWHERLHAGQYETAVWDQMIPMVQDELSKKTAYGLMSRLIHNWSKTYGEESTGGLLNEAWTHAAEAVRFNDYKALVDMGQWDDGPEGVKSFVKNLAQKMLPSAARRDSVVARGFQMRLEDLIRRSSREPAVELNRAAQMHGMRAWYNPEAGNWNIWMNEGHLMLKDIHQVWDYFLKWDPRIMYPEVAEGWEQYIRVKNE